MVIILFGWIRLLVCIIFLFELYKCEVVIILLLLLVKLKVKMVFVVLCGCVDLFVWIRWIVGFIFLLLINLNCLKLLICIEWLLVS